METMELDYAAIEEQILGGQPNGAVIRSSCAGRAVGSMIRLAVAT